jgi:hypothetical protein
MKPMSMRVAGYVARMRQNRISHKVFVRTFQGRRLPGRHKQGWEGNIKIELKELGWVWIGIM